MIPEKLEKIAVSEVMTKNPIVLHKGTTVEEALEMFEGVKLRVLPVISENANVVGVVNLEDLGYVDVRRPGISLSETIMHKPTVMSVNATLEHVAQLM